MSHDLEIEGLAFEIFLKCEVKWVSRSHLAAQGSDWRLNDVVH